MPTRLTLLQINDTHGYLEPHAELFWTAEGPDLRTAGGFARIASIFAEARQENPGGVLAFDNGDTFHGTPELVESRGAAAVPILNALGLSAMTGHWDFAYGPARAAELASALRYPFLAANCHALTPEAPRFAPTTVCEASGLRIGVIGLAATILDKTMPPAFSEGLRFTDGIEECRSHAARLRGEGCHLILVLSHLGLPQDCALADAVPGIDVLLSGHTHNRLETPVKRNGALLIQSGCHGSFVGRLDLEIEAGRIVKVAHRLIPVTEEIPEEPEMARLVAHACAATAALKDQVVGRTSVLLHRASCLDAPMDDALLAAIAAAAGTEIAFSNGWRYGAPIAPGPITEHALRCIVPTDPPVETVDLIGAEILAMMEANLEATFSGSAFRQRGGYVKRFRGLTLNVKLENPESLRIELAFGPDGSPLHPEAVYRAAFITTQGVPKAFGNNRQRAGVTAVEALRRWFAADPAAPEGVGRLRIT